MTLGFTESKSYSNLCFKVEGGRPVMLLLCVDALGMEVWTREVCSRDPEEVWDDGLHDHTYGIKPKAIECCFIRVS